MLEQFARHVLVDRYVHCNVDVEMSTFACALGGSEGSTLYVLLAPSSSEAEAAGKGLGRIVAFDVEVPHAGLP